jgi:hypothetical protein
MTFAAIGCNESPPSQALRERRQSLILTKLPARILLLLLIAAAEESLKLEQNNQKKESYVKS